MKLVIRLKVRLTMAILARGPKGSANFVSFYFGMIVAGGSGGGVVDSSWWWGRTSVILWRFSLGWFGLLGKGDLVVILPT